MSVSKQKHKKVKMDTKKYYKYFGNRLKDLIKNSEYSCKELAQMLNCTSQTIYSYRSSRILPSVQRLLAICSIFEETPDTILGYF